MSRGVAPRMPYIGLRPFDEPDQRLFFGREEQVNETLHRLEDHCFLAVIGASGSGKSSFVRAGLLPAIREGFLLGTTDWHIVVIKPGHEPYQHLAHELDRGRRRKIPSDGLSVIAALRNSDQGVTLALQECGVSSSTRVLIVVDQFEELFGFRRPNARKDEVAARDEASAFVRMLLHATADRQHAVHVAITMRSDFMGDAEAFLGLPEAISRSQFLVPRLTRHQMEDVIVRPGAVPEVMYRPFTFEADLVNRIVNDAGDRSDQLPLMQHALMRTWKRAVERTGTNTVVLRHEDYTEAGGIEQALSIHADTAWDKVKNDPKLAHLTQRLFLLLCDVSADGQITRRRPRIEEVRAVTGADTKAIGDVLRIFQEDDRNFLLPPAGTKLTDDVALDISHESLVRQWKRFADWVTEETESAGTLQRLRESALLWPAREGLLRDPALTVALDWLKEQSPSAEWASRYGGGLDRIREYVAKSGDARRLEEQAKKDEQERELEEAKRRAAEQAANARRFLWTTVAFALLFLATLAVAVYAVRQRNTVQVLSTSNEDLEKRRTALEGDISRLQASRLEIEETSRRLESSLTGVTAKTAELEKEQQKLQASNAMLARIGEAYGSIRLLEGDAVAVTFQQTADPPDEALALLPRAGRVRTLSLSRTKVTDAGLRSLSQLKDLETLDLSFTDVGDSGVAHLAGMQGLRQLVLNDTMITHASLAILAKMTRLKSVNLSRTRVNEEAVEQLRRMLPGAAVTYQADPFLDALSKSGGDMNEALRVAKGSSGENSIHFFGSGITDAALKFLDAESLELSYCSNVTNAGLKQLLRHRSLRSLKLDHGQVTDEGIENLAGLPLTRIELEDLSITDRGMAALGRMRGLTSVRISGLNQQVTDNGVAALLPLKALEDFYLSFSRETSGASIETLRKIQSLKTLKLISNDNIPGQAYRALRDLPALRTLDVSYSDAVTDANIEDLAALKQLETLVVDHTGLTAAGLQRLRTALPKVKFEEPEPANSAGDFEAAFREVPTEKDLHTPGVVSGVLTDAVKVLDVHPVQAWSLKGCEDKNIEIDLISSDFEPLLVVVRPPPSEMLVDDSTGGGSNRRLSFSCSIDDKVIVASGDDKTGKYELKVTIREP